MNNMESNRPDDVATLKDKLKSISGDFYPDNKEMRLTSFYFVLFSIVLPIIFIYAFAKEEMYYQFSNYWMLALIIVSFFLGIFLKQSSRCFYRFTGVIIQQISPHKMFCKEIVISDLVDFDIRTENNCSFLELSTNDGNINIVLNDEIRNKLLT